MKKGVCNSMTAYSSHLAVPLSYDFRDMDEEQRRRQEHAIEKLYLSIRELVGTGELRERLASAYISHLSPLSPDDFPEALRGEYRSIYKPLTLQPPEHPGQDKLQSTIDSMSVEEAVDLAHRLVILFWALVRIHHSETE